MTDEEASKPAETTVVASQPAQAAGSGAPAASPPEPVPATDQQTDALTQMSPVGQDAGSATVPLNPVMDDVWTGLKRLPNYARLATSMIRDPRVPRSAKTALVIGGGYLISPFDLIPGIIPIAGQIDDLYVVLAALRQAIQSTPDEVAREHLHNAGVTRSDLDSDLAAIRRLVKVAAVKTARFGWRMARQTSQQILQLANQARDRARKGPDHEPL